MKRLLETTYALGKMYEKNPIVRGLLQSFTSKFLQLCNAERFDPRSIVLGVFSPKSEPDKMVVTLEKALYLQEPFKVPPPNFNSASQLFVRKFKSLYSSFLASNGRVEDFVRCCDELCNALFVITHYIAERQASSVKTLKGYDIMLGDNLAGDLVFYIYLKRAR